MIKLIKISDSDYMITESSIPSPVLKGIKEVKRVMDYLGVDEKEIECALKDLKDKGNSIAIFGVNKMFVYTKSFGFANVMAA